jgi:hypothetical protein
MTRNTKASLVYATTIAAAAVAVMLVSTSAYAESPTIETPFVSSMTRAQVQAELKTPFIGGDPWAQGYNIVRTNTASTEQVRSAYKMSREEVNALTSEDSGSAYLGKLPLRVKATATMGGRGEDPSNLDKAR